MKANTSLIRRLALVTGLLAGMALTANAAAFMKLGDIKGESTDHGHEGWINLQSISQGLGRALVTDSSGVTRRRGDVILEDITCVKELDKASPKLMEACVNGTVIPSAEIVFTRPDAAGQEQVYLKYKLTNVMVTSYSVGGAETDNLGSSGMDGVRSGNGDEAGTTLTVCSLKFEEIKVTYVAQDGTGERNEFQARDEEETATPLNLVRNP